MARKPQNKPIVELDKPGGRIITYWRSAKAASEFFNINQVNISYNVNNITKQAKGHYFRFATKQEIEDYEKILRQAAAAPSAEAAPVEPTRLADNTPVETIPEVVQKPEIQDDTLSPFARLLQNSKKKFNDNSD